MTATQPPGRPHSGWARNALREALGRLRSLNHEFIRGQEAMFRSTRAPRPGPRPDESAGKDAPAA
jgi:hypothetical protein